MAPRRRYPVPQVGERFFKWTVVSGLVVKSEGRKQKFVRIRCDCGTERLITPNHLVNGHSSMCDRCHRAEVGAEWFVHGQQDSPLYTVWTGMKCRCYVPSSKAYPAYGAAGIKVCDEWRDDFVAFKDWAIQAGYASGLQIDREDNSGDYTPDNCRWVTRSVNCRNRSSNHSVTAWGETKLIIEWFEDPRCAVKYATLRERVAKGWVPEEAISLPNTRPRFATV